MYKITKKVPLNDFVTLIEVEAPYVARHAKAGQFIILRTDENGERIPLTIAGSDRETGMVRVIYQKVGATTKILDTFNEGDCLLDFAGPLGTPSRVEGIERACVIGGGLGVAIALPQAKALKEAGAKVDLIVGFRNQDLIILEKEMREASDNLTIMTDDGSNGNKGFVTGALEEKLKNGAQYDEVIAIGPLMMMKAVSEMTRPYGIKTTVSMNSIMIDGTGMCGGCRVKVGGEVKFACVDGPDFDGHQVDFDSAARRGRMYFEEEKEATAHHICRLTGGAEK